jgi:hypothetical protein
MHRPFLDYSSPIERTERPSRVPIGANASAGIFLSAALIGCGSLGPGVAETGGSAGTDMAVDGGGNTGGSGGIGGSGGTGEGDAGAGMGGSGGADEVVGTTADCGVQPTNPNASPQARKLLCYLYSLYGNHILSGQEESTWVAGSEYEMGYIHTNTGKYPAIRGMDLGQTGVGDRGVAWGNAGGISLVGYHMGAPPLSDTYDNTQVEVTGEIDAALTPGTPAYASFLSKLDAAAAEFQKLKDASIPVLWRPFHEAGGTWFWWSMEGGAQYVRLWKFAYDYLTTTKGLDNLLWLWASSGMPDASFYPGKAYVDIGGADAYPPAGSFGPLATSFNATSRVVGSTIPIALHECGSIPDPAQLQSSGIRWVFFNTWHTTFIVDSAYNPVAHLQAVYGSSYVVTRGQVPSLK